jgi:Flp pilus assembly protein TadG
MLRVFRLRRARLFKEERGATAIIVVLSLIALVGMVALAVDGGTLVMQRRRLVRTADAAAMAAALSFAYPNPPQSVCGTDETVAMAKADEVAVANAVDATRDPTLPGTTITGWKTDCVAHTVTVKYRAPATLGFAPALGFAQNRFVSATATARWITGTPNAFFGVSMMLRASWLNSCKDANGVSFMQVADPDGPGPEVGVEPALGTSCGLWMNNRVSSDLLGDANWGMLNLVTQPYDGSSWGKWGWDVPDDYNCSAVDASYRSLWLEQGVNWPLTLNSLYPNHTYVCNVTGGSNSVIQTLTGQVGNIKQWPINCAQADVSPYCDGRGQIDSSGVLCPPDVCPQPDKYDIIGFIPLEVDQVLYGNDPTAIGSPMQTGDCKKNFTFDQDGGIDPITGLPTPPVLNVSLDTFNGNGCPGGTVFDSIAPYNGTGTPDPYAPYVFTKQGNNPPVPKIACTDLNGTPPQGKTSCDYYYDTDPSTSDHVLTWLNWSGGTSVGVTIEFNWTKNATSGLCGTHPSDPNAKCVMLSWQGEQQGGEGGEGTGYDFGTNGVSLCPDPPDPCP